MFVESAENFIEVTGAGSINLGVTLDCGQAFRWKKNDDDSWTGVVRGIETTVKETQDGLRFYGITKQQFEDIFFDYFDFGRDYDRVLKALSRDETMDFAVKKYGTIRILRQEPWEALCSFIFSACNNIPRIKGIIERFSENFGEKTKTSYTFPTAEKTASLTLDDLSVLRAGFRAPYVLNAAKAVASGEINLSALYYKNLEECEKELMKLQGVGKKVADCTLLFGLGHAEAFPVDRHIKRICEKLYPAGLPEYMKGVEGIAQQYMFHVQRMGDIN